MQKTGYFVGILYTNCPFGVAEGKIELSAKSIENKWFTQCLIWIPKFGMGAA
jgi:hypothetical protein